MGQNYCRVCVFINIWQQILGGDWTMMMMMMMTIESFLYDLSIAIFIYSFEFILFRFLSSYPNYYYYYYYYCYCCIKNHYHPSHLLNACKLLFFFYFRVRSFISFMPNLFNDDDDDYNECKIHWEKRRKNKNNEKTCNLFIKFAS